VIFFEKNVKKDEKAPFFRQKREKKLSVIGYQLSVPGNASL